MRVPAFPIIASVVLLAAPALAQTSTIPSAQPAASSAASKTTSRPTVTPDTQQKIRQSLEQSGFKDVRVVPESFVIHAQAPDGSRIAMMISPDGVTEVVEETGTSTPPPGSRQSAPSTSYEITSPTR